MILSQKEKDTIKQIKTYIEDMDDLIDGCNIMNDNYANKKLENTQIINAYETLCNSQLPIIKKNIITNLAKISKIIEDTHNALNQKLQNYKQNVNDIKLKEENRVNEFDEKNGDVLQSISTQKEYFKDKLSECKAIIAQYAANNNGDTLLIDDDNTERETAITQLGNIAAEQYKEQMNTFTTYRQDINEYIAHCVVPPFTRQNQEIYTMTVNNEILNRIGQDITSFITIYSAVDDVIDTVGTKKNVTEQVIESKGMMEREHQIKNDRAHRRHEPDAKEMVKQPEENLENPKDETLLKYYIDKCTKLEQRIEFLETQTNMEVNEKWIFYLNIGFRDFLEKYEKYKRWKSNERNNTVINTTYIKIKNFTIRKYVEKIIIHQFI